MAQRLRARGGPRLRGAVLAVGALALLAWTSPAVADHSLGLSCLTCHALRSTKVKAGTRNILVDRLNYRLYDTFWYCGTGLFVGGDPLDCSYCHESFDDIGSEIGRAGAGTGAGSAHPVDVLGAIVSYGTPRITCNDCHNADVGPATLCSKTDTDGYPNHLNLSAVPDSTGSNKRTGAATHLQVPYGNTVDWTGTLDGTTMLCFKCHDGSNALVTNVKQAYDPPGGGHNIRYLRVGKLQGATSPRLGCYHCHDPHAATQEPNPVVGWDNKKLILNGADTPSNPYGTSNFSTGAAFTGANDRVVCYGCHNGAYTVEGLVPGPSGMDNVLATTWRAEFTYHDHAHDDVRAGGNCLQKNQGCHLDAHNTDVFRCLDCHTKTIYDQHPTPNPKLVAKANVDSEFGHLGWKGQGTAKGNAIVAQHNIVYDVAADLSLPQNNGCVGCHNCRRDEPGATVVEGAIVRGWNGTPGKYFARPTLSAREDLKGYDEFCLTCHDGTGLVYGTNLRPPRINNPASETSWNTGYFFKVGHGRGNGSETTRYSPSNNSPAKIPCLECHVYHGATAFKLLPGPGESADGWGRVIKGGTYSPKTTGVLYTIGGVGTSAKIDYADYTDPANNSRLLTGTVPNGLRSLYVSDYTNATPYSSFHNTGTIDTPKGLPTPFGTSGDMHDNTRTSDEASCDQNAGTATKIGFCNACHFYSSALDGTQETYGWVYTHEAYDPDGPGPLVYNDCSSADLRSQMRFFKDCAECHDPHGSGPGNADDQGNIYMIRTKIKTGFTDTQTKLEDPSYWSAVQFTARSGLNSYDESDTDNTDDLCAVCHTSPTENSTFNVDHNYRTQTTTPSHNEGSATPCTLCHPHGEK